jgi:hypothetical protein
VLDRLLARLGPPLPEGLRGAFADEIAETARRRGAAFLPVMAVAHLLHVAVFGTFGSARATVAPAVLQWRDGIALVHAVTFVLAAALAVFALGRRRGAPPPRALGPLMAALYLHHGAVIAAVDQLQVTSVTPFVGYALGIAVIVPLRPRVAALLDATALLVFVAGIIALQPSSTARLAELPNGVSIMVVSFTLALVSDGARRRDFLQRRTIDEQAEALRQLNSGLERRIEGQVSEIVKRAEEVERLNAQLTSQVRARSAELSIALSKLAQQRDETGVLRTGVVLGDRFEVRDPLGEGGMGVVYSGLDRRTGEPVAIKVIQASSTRQLDALHRFLREAASAATVSHPAVVRTFHVDVSEDGMLFQVQELVEGVTLQSRIRAGHRWDPGVVARAASVLCEALAAAHAKGIVHRDVKPGNVMLTRVAPGIKLLDFGIAKLYEDALADDAGTRTGAILGTPAFMAPEQVDGRDVTDRADVYAAGVILFLLLTGKYPFGDATPRQTLLNHVLLAPPNARDLEPAVPSEMAKVVAACLGKDPGERPTAAEVSRTLAAMADAGGTPALQDIDARDVDALVNEQQPTVATGKRPAASA